MGSEDELAAQRREIRDALDRGVVFSLPQASAWVRSDGAANVARGVMHGLWEDGLIFWPPSAGSRAPSEASLTDKGRAETHREATKGD